MTTENCYARLLDPRVIGASNLVDSSVHEPSAGEVEWVSGASTAIGDLRIRSTTHRVYRDAAGGVSTVPPESDPTRWKDEGPTNRWAWADYYESTITTGDSPVTIRVRPGTFNSIMFRALNAGSVRVQCWDTPGGTLYHDHLYSTDDYLTGDLMWEFYFGNPRQRNYLLIEGLSILYPMAEVLITLDSIGEATTASVGLIAFGTWELLGLPEYPYDVDFIDRSQIDEEPITGRIKIKQGIAAKNISGTHHLDAADANRVADLIGQYLGVPVAMSISRNARHDYLNTFGLISATVSAAGPTHAKLRLRMRGIV